MKNIFRIIEFRHFNSERVIKISAGADGVTRSQVCARLTLRSASHRHQWRCTAHAPLNHHPADFGHQTPPQHIQKDLHD